MRPDERVQLAVAWAAQVELLNGCMHQLLNQLRCTAIRQMWNAVERLRSLMRLPS